MAKHRLDTRPNYTFRAFVLAVVAVTALLVAWASADVQERPSQAILAAVESWEARPAPTAVEDVSEVPTQACAEMLAARFPVDSWTVTDGGLKLEMNAPAPRRELATYVADRIDELGVAYITYQSMVNIGGGWVTMDNHGERKTVFVMFRSGSRCEE